MSVDSDTFEQIDSQYVRHLAWQEAERVSILRFFEVGNSPNFLVSIKKKGGSQEDPSLWGILIPGLDLNKGRIIVPSGEGIILKNREKSFVISEISRHNSKVVSEINFSKQENDGSFVVRSFTSGWQTLELDGGKVAQCPNEGFLVASLAEGISIEFNNSFPNLELNPLKLPKSIYDDLRVLYPQD